MGSSAGSSHTARKKAPSRWGTAVVTNASSSAKVTLKTPSVVTTKMKVMPSAPSSRVSRVTMRSKFSSVNLPTASVRPMSVNARTTSMMTGATKNTASSTSAGPRNRAKLIRCRRSWARAKSGMAKSWRGPENGRRSTEAPPRSPDVPAF
jgi:hypothetical protein